MGFLVVLEYLLLGRLAQSWEALFQAQAVDQPLEQLSVLGHLEKICVLEEGASLEAQPQLVAQIFTLEGAFLKVAQAAVQALATAFLVPLAQEMFPETLEGRQMVLEKVCLLPLVASVRVMLELVEEVAEMPS